MTTPPKPTSNTLEDQRTDIELAEHVAQAEQANAQTAARDGYDGMSAEQLRRLAAERHLPNRKTRRKRDQLIADLRNADALALDRDPGLAGFVGGAPDPEPPPPSDQYSDLDPTLAQALREQDARDAEAVSEHGDLLERASAMSAFELRGEMAGKTFSRSVTAQLEAMLEEKELSGPTPVEGRFRVTRDSRYSFGGMTHRLARGSIVSASTHPLEEIRRQKVPLEPVSSIQVATDLFGRHTLLAQ